MKHFLLKAILPAFLLLGATSLIACNSNKLPTNNYEKVKFAFNGVEKSLANPKASKKSLALNKKERLGGSNPESGLATIFSLYTSEDKRDDFLDDVEYNQPPMVQFQYMKKVLEKVGSGYEFGTKYYDTVTGDVLLDIQTGLKSKNEDDKFNYTFGLGIDINIDSNDLITADVSFDIKIARGQEEYKTKWYVAIELDYDMANSSPNYTMTMVTENNESELPYYQHYTYEYDYVEVKNSSINEWRKFCMDNNHRLIKDSAHQTFESYTTGDAKYKVDACSWYKDGNYYKNKRPRELNGNEAKTVGEALFTDLGLNANEINADAFFNKNSTPNSVLKTCYQEFCKIAKEDIIYSLLTREEQGGEQQQQQRTAIRAMNGDLKNPAENYLIPKDTSIGQVFNGFVDGHGEKRVVVLCYVDQNGALMEEIKDLDSLTFFFKLRDKDSIVMFEDLGRTLEEAYKNLIENYEISENDLQRECQIIFMSKENQELYGMMPIAYDGALPSVYTKPEWPKALADLGLPEYYGQSVQYSFNEQGERKVLNINNTNYDEGEEYCQKLRQNGFEYNYEINVQQNEVAFKKSISDQYNICVIFHYGKDTTNFVLTAWREEAQQGPVQPYSVYAIGDFNNWDEENPIVFIASYEEWQWVFTLEDFTVSEGQTFSIVINLNTQGERYLDFGEIMDPRGYIEPDAKGSSIFKALKSFTANIIVEESGALRFDFVDATEGIQYLTFIGSFNDWNEKDGLIEMEKKSDYVFEKIVGFDEGVEFKIMQNHSWDVNYGYKEIKAFQSADMKTRFAEGEYGNVLMKKALTFKLTATIDDSGLIFKVDIIA